MGKVGISDYQIEIKDQKVKIFHANLLKKYNKRQSVHCGILNHAIAVVLGTHQLIITEQGAVNDEALLELPARFTEPRQLTEFVSAGIQFRVLTKMNS